MKKRMVSLFTSKLLAKQKGRYSGASKRIIALSLCVGLLCANLTMSASAITPPGLPDPLTGPQKIIAACAYGNGQHDMRQYGGTSVFVPNGDGTSTRIFYGSFFQCQNHSCTQTIVTEWDPISLNYIGRYATYDPGCKVTGCNYLLVNESAIGNYTGDLPFPGYTFRCW